MRSLNLSEKWMRGRAMGKVEGAAGGEWWELGLVSKMRKDVFKKEAN